MGGGSYPKEQVEGWDWIWHLIQEGHVGRKEFQYSQVQARHPTSLRGTLPDPRSPLSQIPSSPGAWALLSPGLLETPPLLPSWPSYRSLPQAFAEPETWNSVARHRVCARRPRHQKATNSCWRPWHWSLVFWVLNRRFVSPQFLSWGPGVSLSTLPF